MKRAPHTAAGPSSRQRKEADCLEAKFERQSHHHALAPATVDLSAWANEERFGSSNTGVTR